MPKLNNVFVGRSYRGYRRISYWTPCDISLVMCCVVIVCRWNLLDGYLDRPFKSGAEFANWINSTCRQRPGYCQKPIIFKLDNVSVVQLPWTYNSYKDYCSTKVNPNDNLEGINQHDRLKFPEWRANLTADIYFYRKLDDNSCHQALNLSWSVPRKDLNGQILGFRLELNREIPYKNIYATENFYFFVKWEAVKVDANGNMHFVFDCLRVFPAAKFRMLLFILIHNSSNVHDNVQLCSEAYRGPEIFFDATNISTSCEGYPGSDPLKVPQWKTETSYKYFPVNSTVEVHFRPAPDYFRFKSYIVTLLSNISGMEYYTLKNVKARCTDYGPVIFKYVCSDIFLIKVRPYGGDCPCIGHGHEACRQCTVNWAYGPNSSNSPYSCESTVPTSTIKQILPSSKIGPLQSVTEPILTTVSDNYNQNKTWSMIVGFGIAVGVVCIILVLFFLYRKRRYINEITPKSVVLIYASDNIYHCNVVRSFAYYLQHCCLCNVRFDEWFQNDISRTSALEWMLREIRSVDNVIIINSEGGFRQYTAHMNGMALEKVVHEVTLEDMFLAAMKEIRNQYFLQPNCRRYFKVVFPYTNPEFVINDINADKTYQLMTKIEDLILNIHGISKFSGLTTRTDINDRYYMNCSEGSRLKVAITKACQHIKDEPEWFSDFYQNKENREGIKDDCQHIRDQSSCFSDFYQENMNKNQANLCPGFDSGLGMEDTRDDHLYWIKSKGEPVLEFIPPTDDISSSGDSELWPEKFNQDFDNDNF